jgi:PelA/Pel-15E family pectate lyase
VGKHPARQWLSVAVAAVVFASSALLWPQTPPAAQEPDRRQILDTMKRATVFMVDTVSTNGGYVWSYLPDLSRRWGELEARDTMIWVQPPGTPAMGHLFLDAYHATGDEYYYQAAEKAANALIWGQLPSGGWNYMIDFGGDRSLRDWYATIGRNAWRLEEFQHYWGNATFDDAGTVEASKLLLRLYVEKRDPKFKPALDKAIQFVVESQYPVGAWPQRYPLKSEFVHHGKPDYTSFLTFNDDVAAENIDFLIMAYQALGDERLLDPIVRGMNVFLVTQQGPPQAGWALQYTPDLKPTGARTYEPDALVTHTTARNIELLIHFYRLTGETKFLARVPEALDWLKSVELPAGVAPEGRTHPTFIEIGTNKPLYVHREGSNVVNGRYYVDYNPKNTLGHYSAFRRVDLAALRKQYEDAKAEPRESLAKKSPLSAGAGVATLARYFTVSSATVPSNAGKVIADLNARGFWSAPLEYNSYPYRGDGSPKAAPGDFSTAHVGDTSDTSPFRDDKLTGISTAAYIRNMGVLIRALDGGQRSQVLWRLDNLTTIDGATATTIGQPRVVQTDIGSAVEFNGSTDGLLIDDNPLRGFGLFTIEVVLAPAADGPEEQRFLHFEDVAPAAGTASRALLELRLDPRGLWSLDTYLRHREVGLTLLDRGKTHQAGRWAVVALTYDGKTMAHYVNGQGELSGEIAFEPFRSGRTSIGVRQNRVSWFKGRIHSIRITPRALTSGELMPVPQT